MHSTRILKSLTQRRRLDRGTYVSLKLMQNSLVDRNYYVGYALFRAGESKHLAGNNEGARRDWKKAKAWLDTAANSGHFVSQAHYVIGEIYRREAEMHTRHTYSEALEELAEAIKEGGRNGNPEALYEEAIINVRTNKKDVAFNELRKAAFHDLTACQDMNDKHEESKIWGALINDPKYKTRFEELRDACRHKNPCAGF